MISPASGIKLYIATAPVDMRKAIDGLSQIVAETLTHNPQQGHGFIFNNRQRNKIKLLYWDKNGFVLIYKRMEKGKFQFPKNVNIDHYEIDAAELQWLLAGLDFMQLKSHPELDFSHYS